MNRNLRLLTVFPLLIIALIAMSTSKNEAEKVIIGYVGGYRGLVDVSRIAPKKLTHINYAFINVKNNRAFINRPETDTVNLRKLVSLKTQNPKLKVLISIGGWAWSENFSDASLTDTARIGFAKSAVEIARKFNLDGLDIDWEYPGIAGEEGNVFRPEDKTNFTLLMAALRDELNKLESETGSKKLLTIAVGGFNNYITHTEMDKVQAYLDFINLMTYDFYPGDGVAVHHTNLYNSEKYKGNSADAAFNAFNKAGVPANKLVMGIAFYGRMIKLKGEAKNGLADSVQSMSYGKGFTFIRDSLINKKGFKHYVDKSAKAPYIFNSETKEFMTFDDEKSVMEKCRYVKKNQMAGVMFWEHDSDLKGYLLDQINKDIK
jgi:chitinase